MSNNGLIAGNLAAAFLSGAWSRAELLKRGKQAFAGKSPWLRPLVSRILKAFPESPGDRYCKTLAAFIEDDSAFVEAGEKNLRRIFWAPPAMTPVTETAVAWKLPPLITSTALADWLDLKPAELDWFADCHAQEVRVKSRSLRHYSYRWLPKRSTKWRLLEMPKLRLKALQRRVLHEILDRIPPHEAAHGYRQGRSIATFASHHCNQRIVMRFDLRHFFPSVNSSRIHALFTTAGYPSAVARLLTGLCTNVAPDDILLAYPDSRFSPLTWDEQQRYRSPHLPQGAPTSPAIANLCAYRLDCRMSGLARSMGAVYTRYADDLAFSGDRRLERSIQRFKVQVCIIALEEGFDVHLRKSRFMRRAVRQQLAGVVVNAHPNFRRDEYDRLKAILHNCARKGPDSQNRMGHPDFRLNLLGRISHVTMLNATRGQRLRSLFDQICWDPTPTTEIDVSAT